MDKNLPVGGRFVDNNDTLLVVVEGEGCVGCVYEHTPCLKEIVRPLCSGFGRKDGKPVIFIPAIEPKLCETSGRTVAEIRTRIKDFRPNVEGMAQLICDELLSFIDPPMTYTQALRAVTEGHKLRRKGNHAVTLEPALVNESYFYLCFQGREDMKCHDWEIVPETNTDGS